MPKTNQPSQDGVIRPAPTAPGPWLRGELCLAAVLLALAWLVACAPRTPPPPTPTFTPLPPTATFTPTPVWFPPTATPTPLPSPTLPLTPTVDLRPQYGALLWADDFSQPGLWQTGSSPVGRISLGANALTLAVARPKGYLYSLRQGETLRDFYLEITAMPTICRGTDEYGLLLRVSPALEFYRLALTCDGQARLDRYFAGRATAPLPLTPSGAVPRGAPSATRLGVWAVGKELRFYANGAFLFSLRDPSLPAGGLGVFARAGGPDPVTVNFLDLAVYQPSP